MKKFETTRKILALLLSLTLITGMIPATALSAFAAETNEVVDYAIVMSDLHTTQSNNKASTLKGVLNAMKNDGINATTVNSSGDMFSVNETNYNCNTSAITSAIKEVYGSADINYVWTDHDRTSDISKESGLVYGTGEDEEYYVYLLSMADLSSWDRYGAGFYSASEISNHIEAFRTTVAGLDKTKPLFIVGHQPLFNDRGDNGYAYQWVTAINEIATTMDVAYFNGHNHNYDTESNYYYEKGTTVDVPTTKVLSGSGYSTKLETKAVEFKFTHINAGYLSPSTGNSSNTRMGTALAVTIYEDSIQYTTYDKNGVYKSTFAVNETVDREYAKKASDTVTDLDGMVSVTATSPGLTGITATNVVAEKKLESYFADYVAYEVELEGYQEGEDVRYSMYLLDDMDATNLELYLVGDNGEMTPITFKKVTDEQGNQYLEFTVKGDGCFAYGAPNVPDGYTLSKIEISNVIKTVYYQGESLDMVNPVVTATYTKDGAKDFERILCIVSEGYEDGYTISGYDMTQVGKQTVTITYGDKTTSFDITVKQKGAVDEKYGIRVEDAEDNITSLAVERTVKTVEGYDAYVLYDIVPAGYVQGTETTVTIPVDDTIFDVTRPVKVIDIERDTTKNAFIEDGKVTFTTNHFTEYAVVQPKAGTATTVDGVVATSVSTTATNSIESGSYYLIENIRREKLLIGEPDAVHSNNLDLNGAINSSAIAYNNIWYITETTGGYHVSYKNADGKYLTIGDSSASLNDNAVVTSMKNQTTSGVRYWNLSQNDYYLNAFNNEDRAAGWKNRNASTNEGSRWSLYKVTTAPVTMSVNESDLGMFVGDAKNLTVNVSVNNTAVTGSTITWESSDEDVVTVNDEGQLVAVGAGTAEITAILASVDNGRLLAPARVTIPVQVGVFVEGTTIDITHKATQRVVDRTLVVKKVETNSTYELDYKVFVDGIAPETKPTDNIVWSSSNEDIATVENGLVTFHGEEGVVRITVSYEYEEGTHATDTVLISVSKGNYMLPSDGTNDFPEYPNEGSIRYDKTATAVGNFSETGIAQLELSMTGVPFTSENRMDVVLMLDRSSSMYKTGVQHRISSTIEATKAFVKNVVINEDGTFNNNRIIVMDFLGGNVAQGSQHQYESNLYTQNEEKGYEIISSQAELDALFKRIDDGFKGQTSLYGTEYAQGLKDCYDALNASQTDGNKQFCVFMSDGIPNYMMGEKTHFQSTNNIVNMFNVTNYNKASANATRGANYEYEKYSSMMKDEGVTVFTVGLGLKNTNSAWSNASAAACEQVANMLLNDISGPAYEKDENRDTGNAVSKMNEYFFSVADDDAAAQMKDVFSSIAKKILEAARDVKVTDKIADEYTMIFDIPEGPDAEFIKDKLPDNQEFYMEFVEYTLKPVVEQGVTTNYVRDTNKVTSLMKLYLGKKNGNFFAASDSKGTAYAAPVFAEVAEGKKGYYNLVDGAYEFTADGDGTHNMVSGARVSGTTNDNLIIETPYVHYEAETRMLIWTAEKLSSSELALRYFLYLNDSAAELPANQVDAGTYPTNDFATLEYTNFQNNECQQIFPKPQMTWNGAQVSYVFYLVNQAGQPVNRAGRVVPFSEAVYVTDIFTYAVTWNKNDASAELVEEYLATDKVPDVFDLYDKHAGYNIYVYETEDGMNKNNHFEIVGSSKEANTTYVFNAKSDTVKYRNPGTYNKNNVYPGFDFSNTTVAFAVVWKPKLAEDTVVIDYGLPVDIDVARNDAVAGSVTGLFDANNAAMLQDVKINEGQISNRVQFATALNSGQVNGIKHGRAEVLNNTTVRYTPVDMKMSTSDKFYYVSTLNYYAKDKNGNDVLEDSRMYSSVTVIPATTIYYEDTFVSYEHGYGATNDSNEGTPGKWETVGTANASATQDEDRPGESQIAADLDADNIYGYDSAYTNCDTYSLGSAHKVNLNKKPSGTDWPSATFTFTGTGFDVISQTSNTTGTIAVTVSDSEGKALHNWIVDTYYGYTAEKAGYKENTFTFGNDGKWHLTKSEVVDSAKENGVKKETPSVGDTVVVYEENIVWTPTTGGNALYQIPVIKSPELEYGTYTVTITPRYSTGFDHTGNGNYDFYLDAIRVYNPANDGSSDVVVNDAYKADGEAYPDFMELRKALLAKDDFLNVKENVKGAVFIDGFGTDGTISDYKNYGPNNEIYLQKGQAVAFVLESDSYGLVNSEHLGIKSPNGGDVAVTVSALDASGAAKASKQVATSSATEQYFDISDCITWNADGNSDVIVISNTSDSMVSLTNIKVTYNVQDAEPAIFTMSHEAASRAVSFMSARYMDSVDTAEAAEVLNLTTDKTSYTAKDTVKATIKTNDAAEYITVNGEKITDYSVDGSSRIWTYEVQTLKVGSVELTAIAYNKLDESSDAVSKTVAVKKFAPKTFKIALDKSKVIVGEKVKATVTTSNTVKYAVINGKKVTKYTTNKAGTLRYWTSEVKATKVGSVTFKAVAYNANGSASDTITKTIKATNFAPKTFKIAVSSKTVKTGAKYTVTITTSSDVKYVTVNGKKLTKCKYNKAKTSKTFTVTNTAKTTGKNTVKVVAHNKNGSASKAKSTTVTVKRK